MRVALMCIALLFMTSLHAHAEEPASDRSIVRLDPELFSGSRYIDIVYVNGRLSYISYLTALDEDSAGPALPCLGQPKKEGRKKGIWLWNMAPVKGREKDVVARLILDGFKKIYVQIGPDLGAIASLVDEAWAGGMEVFALDGSPSDIDDYASLLGDIERISEYNLMSGRTKIAGLQIDVEPYLKKDFNLRKDYYSNRYLQMVRDIKQKAGGLIKLSVAMPFWFDKLEVDGKPLSNMVIDIADEAVIMSYRTSFCGIIDLAGSELAYADQTGKQVYLGLETAKIDDESHYVITKEVAESLLTQTDSMQMDITGLEHGVIHKRHYSVRGSDLSFNGQMEKLSGLLAVEPDNSSFGGYVIHSYESFY